MIPIRARSAYERRNRTLRWATRRYAPVPRNKNCLKWSSRIGFGQSSCLNSRGTRYPCADTTRVEGVYEEAPCTTDHLRVIHMDASITSDTERAIGKQHGGNRC